MNELTFGVIAEKFGVKIFGISVIVCLISAFIKKKWKISGRASTFTEVAISFAVASLYLFISGNFSVDALINNGLSVTGVSLAVCGIICGGQKTDEEGIKQTLMNFADGKLSAEDLKKTLSEAEEYELSEKEAELIAVLATKLKEKTKKE